MSNRQRDWLERVWLPAILLLALIGLVSQTPLLLIAALAVLSVGALAQVWRVFGLRQVSYERLFAERRLFPGERTIVRLRLTNRKLLPLPWLTVAETFDAGLRPLDGPEHHSSLRRLRLDQSFTLGPFEQIEREVSLYAERRGCYRFGAAAASAGDPFGISHSEGSVGCADEVLVYPELLERWEYTLAARQPLGEHASGRPVWRDPARPAGARDYVAGDPLRLLHWRATARLGRLQTRRLDPAAALRLAIVLDVNTAERAWQGVDHALLERAISVVASLARDALEARVPTGLIANALTVNSDQTIRVPIGRFPDQLTAILEHLARLVLYYGLPIAQIIERELPRLPYGSTLALVSALDSPATATALAAAERRGHPVYRYDPRAMAAP